MATSGTNPQNPSQPVISIPPFIFNPDIIGMLDLIGRFVVELVRSNSSNLATISDADDIRWNTYLDAIDRRQAVLMSLPLLDLPQTSHSVQWPVEPLDPVPSMNNDDVEALTRMFTIQHAELANSTSAMASSGISTFDATRMTAITSKTRALLAASRIPPSGLDQPASSPWDPVTPPAK